MSKKEPVMYGTLDRKEAHARFHRYLDLWKTGQIDHVEWMARDCALKMGYYWEDLSSEDRELVLEVVRDAFSTLPKHVQDVLSEGVQDE